jgi:type II secretory pathway pseudopilin PulG
MKSIDKNNGFFLLEVVIALGISITIGIIIGHATAQNVVQQKAICRLLHVLQARDISHTTSYNSSIQKRHQPLAMPSIPNIQTRNQTPCILLIVRDTSNTQSLQVYAYEYE